MPIAWSGVEPFVREAFERSGQVERADVINLAYGQNADDDVVDAIDAIGSRVFGSVEDARSYLFSQNAVSE